MKHPSFQFYPGDWLSDSNVMRMTARQRGIYINLLCHCWIDGQIPTDIDTLNILAGVPRVDEDHGNEAGSDVDIVLKLCFARTKQNEAYIHKRLKKERSKQIKFSQARSDAGKKGGLKSGQTRRLQRSTASKQSPSTASTYVEAKRSSPSSTSVVPPNPPQGGGLIPSGSFPRTDSEKAQVIADVLKILKASGVKSDRKRGVDLVQVEVRHFVEAGGNPETIEVLKSWIKNQSRIEDEAGYLRKLIRSEASWIPLFKDASPKQTRMPSKPSGTTGIESDPKPIQMDSAPLYGDVRHQE